MLQSNRYANAAGLIVLAGCLVSTVAQMPAQGTAPLLKALEEAVCKAEKAVAKAAADLEEKMGAAAAASANAESTRQHADEAKALQDRTEIAVVALEHHRGGRPPFALNR